MGMPLRGKNTRFFALLKWILCKMMDSEYPDIDGTSTMLDTKLDVATGIDWAFVPEWLTLEQAAFFWGGHDRLTMYSITRTVKLT